MVVAVMVPAAEEEEVRGHCRMRTTQIWSWLAGYKRWSSVASAVTATTAGAPLLPAVLTSTILGATHSHDKSRKTTTLVLLG